MGYSATSVKEEVKRAANDGADAVEVLVNIAAIKDKQWTHVQNDLDSVLTMLLASKVRKRLLYSRLDY